MKKFLASAFAFALAISTSVTAFAANTDTNDGTKGTDITVNGTYQAAEAPADVVSVDIVWDNMDFTYTAPSKGTWNANTHEYENATEGGWAATSGTDPKITVTNHSNVPVNANFAFAATVDGLNGSFTETALVLDSAEGTELSNAPKDETAFSVSGSAIDADKNLGTITVTVNTGTMISSAEDLLNSAASGGTFRLANNIALDENTTLEISGKNYILDLNGFTLSGSYSDGLIRPVSNSKVTIKNGTVWNNKNSQGHGVEAYSSELVLENCTVHSYSVAMFSNDNSSVYVTNCSFQTDFESNYTLLNHSSTLTLSGSVNILSGGGLSNQGVGETTKALPGTYNFDVSSYVDTDLYNVTNDGTIWTVTAK